MKRLKEAVAGTHENYIYPFLWMHGEPEAEIRKEIEKIDESGIKGVCIEARPHKDFLGPGWWHDMDIVLEECKKRNMKLWILDDSHFPTGFCNGQVREHPEVRKRYLSCKIYDFAGPMKGAGAVLGHCIKDPADRIEAVILAKKTEYEKITLEGSVDLTDQVITFEKNGQKQYVVNFDLPEGEWSLCVLTESFCGGEKVTEFHLDPMNPEGAKLLLDTVYQPHYDHYKEEFGTTILGFFSDEPRFGNFHGEDASIGRNPQMAIPWNAQMPERLALRCGTTGAELRKELPGLFIESGKTDAVIRYQYMDLVSRLYSENFDKVLADWCTEHHCEHTGHTIEDNNAASRLGYGAGHIYRAMQHQGRAGIDVIMHQLYPGLDHTCNQTRHQGGWDGEFFTYLLAKLGSGIAHSNPQMKGRALCELYGAYGWMEGNRLCKWIADVLFSRGINEFVPHAFDPAPYPDADCPPHFYAHGQNPQYPEFQYVMKYINRVSHLLSGGIHRAPAAILYHAEAEWSGDYQSAQKPAKILTQNQLDYDVLSCDSVKDAEVTDEGFRVNKETYQLLVIPYAQSLPEKVIRQCEKIAAIGGKVIFLEKLPEIYCEDGQPICWEKTLKLSVMEEEKAKEAEKEKQENGCQAGSESGICVMTMEELEQFVRTTDLWDIRLKEQQPELRYYHYEQPDGEVYFLFNEDTANELNVEIKFRQKGSRFIYDPMQNQFLKDCCGKEKNSEEEDGGNQQENYELLTLAPGETRIYIFPEKEEDGIKTDLKAGEEVESDSVTLLQKIPEQMTEATRTGLSGRNREQSEKTEILELETCELQIRSMDQAEFSTVTVLNHPTYLQKIPSCEMFCGRIRYNFEVMLKTGPMLLELDGVREAASVTVNGTDCGTRICPPYCFSLDGIREGKNQITVELNTTLAREQMDRLSQYVPLEPTGMTGARLVKI